MQRLYTYGIYMCGIYGTFVPRACPYKDTRKRGYHRQSLTEPYWFVGAQHCCAPT